MGNDDVDLVKVSKPAPTLREKYDIPIENLSYEYITECIDSKQVERLVQILRSGEEGSYPDLLKHAESRLQLLNPNSIILREAVPVKLTKMLDNKERQEVNNDINEWMRQMQLREKDIEAGKSMNFNDKIIPQPDVRRMFTKNHPTSDKIGIKKRIGSCDYAAWDKYDPDTEIDRIDLKAEKQQAEAKRVQQKQADIASKMSKEVALEKLAMTGTELNVWADQEREKGNEAFKAGDYKEALHLYTSSLMIDSSINAYNNRAMTYIKLKRYEEALDDCNKVLSMDYTNIKSLLRRATSLENLNDNQQAVRDYEFVLKLEPTNKVAICGVKRLRPACPDSRKFRMKIEEERGGGREVELWRRIQEEKNQICFCEKAPSSSKYLRPPPHRKASYCYDNNYLRKATGTMKNDFKIKTSSTVVEGKKLKSLDIVDDVDSIFGKKINEPVESDDEDLEKFKIAIDSPYEFNRCWEGLKNNSSLKNHCKLLRALGPENLEKYVGIKMDGVMFSLIIRCMEGYFCNLNDAEMLVKYLGALSRVKRFSIISMFMDANDSKALKGIFEYLNNNCGQLLALDKNEISLLKSTYLV